MAGCEAVTQCDRSRTEVDKVSRSSAEATSLARTEEMSCNPQLILLVRPLIYPANSIQSDGRRRHIWCYGDAANDHNFGENK